MNRKKLLGALAILILVIAGVSYWAIHEKPEPAATHSAGTPAQHNPTAPENAPSVSQPTQTAEAPPPQTSSQSSASTPAPAQSSASTPASAQSSTKTAAAQPTPAPAPQPEKAPPPPNSSSASAAPQQSTGGSSSSPAAAMAMVMPDEDKMSAANRRQVQEALHRRGYYDGPTDGIFGPLTRAAITRFQDSIGASKTGRLTAAEASRLVNPS